MPVFPFDLFPDILCRLPVKTLVRFKCVAKSWCSLIEEPAFVKLHLDHSLKTSTNIKLFLDNNIESDDKAYAVDFDSLNNLVHFPRPFLAEVTKYRSRILGSCNGLLAVYHQESGIAVWNPSTRKCRYLPPLDDDIVADHDCILEYDYEYDSNTVLGFGYDITSDDYKVVKMLRSKTDGRYKVMIYSMKANSWKRIEDCPYDCPTNYTDGAYVNNSLHWVGDEPGEFYGGQVIFALELATEQYYVVPEGDTSFKVEQCGGDCQYFGYMNAGVLRGCLSVSRNYSNCPVGDHINLWVMKQYGVKESWMELLYLSRDEWLTNIFHTRAVGYSRSGDKVLLDQGGGGRQPAWFDLENETGEVLSIEGAPERVTTMIYVESLVSV